MEENILGDFGLNETIWEQTFQVSRLENGMTITNEFMYELHKSFKSSGKTFLVFHEVLQNLVPHDIYEDFSRMGMETLRSRVEKFVKRARNAKKTKSVFQKLMLEDFDLTVNKATPDTPRKRKLKQDLLEHKRVIKKLKVDSDHFKSEVSQLKDDVNQTEKEKESLETERNKFKMKAFYDYFNVNSNNMKLLWTGIKSIISIKNSHVSVINKLKDTNGNLTTDSTAMANIFNKFFVNVADGVTKNIPRSPRSPLNYLKNKNPSSFFISPTAPYEISDIIDLLKTGKSIGPNSIPLKLLKILSPQISSPLSLIINASFQSGIFPEKMQSAKVIPLFNPLRPSVPVGSQQQNFMKNVEVLRIRQKLAM